MSSSSEAPQGVVLIIYYSTHTVCGIGTWLEILSNELERRNWKVVTGLAWGRKFNNPEQVEQCRPSLHTIRMDARTGTEEGRIQAIERTIRTVKPDVVVLNCLDAGFEAVRRLRVRGDRSFRFIVTNHGNLPIQAACLMGHQDVIDLLACIGRQSIEVMTNPKDGFPTERVMHLPNAVVMPERSRNASDRPMRLGYAARLDAEPRKRLADLPRFMHALFKHRPGVECWIAGSGDQESLVEELVAAYPEQVRYVGSLSKEDLYRDFYPALDVFLNFSSNEAFGLSIAEAMAHGVVPVTSHFTGLAEEGLVLDGVNARVFPVGDLDAAVDQVMDLLEHPEELNRIGEAAIEHIRTHFSPQRAGQHWIDAFAHLQSLPALPRPERAASLEVRGRFGLPEAQWERLRRLLGRQFPHASAGEEWPHYRCRDQALLERVVKAMHIMDPETEVVG